MADGTQVRRVLLQIKTDDGDTEAKLDRISAKADELKEKHPELAVRIDTAAANAKLSVLRQDLKDVGKDVPVIEPKVEDDPAKAKIDELKLKISRLRLEAKGIEIKVDATEAEIKIAELEAEMKGLQDAGNVAGQQAGGGFLSNFSLSGITPLNAAIGLGFIGAPALAGLAGTGMGVAMTGAMAAVVAKSAYSNVQPAVNAYQTALNTVGQAHTQAMKTFASYYDALSGSQQHLVDTITVAENAWQNFVQDNTAGMTKILGQGMGLLPKLFSGMSGILQSVMPQMSGIVRTLGGTLDGLLGVMKASAPAFGPLIRSLLQMVNNVFPGLQAIIRATIPALGTFSQIFAGLGSSVSQTLAALAPGVKASAQFLSGLFRAIGSLLPVVATLASDLAKLLAPIMAQLGGTIMPKLTAALGNILTAVQPLLPPLGQMAAIVGNFPIAVMANGLLVLSNLLVRCEGPIQTVANMLQELANLAATALSWLSKIPGVGAVFSGAGGGLAGGIGGIAGFASTADPFGGGASYGGFSVPSLGGIAGGVNTGPTTYGSRTGTTRPAAANLALILSQGIMAGLTGTASQVQGAISKLLGAVNTDVSGKYLTTEQGTAISKWLEADQSRLVGIADRRARILATIQQADAYAKNVTSSAESTFGVVSAAQSITPALGVGGIMRQLLGDVSQIRLFRSNIAKLRRMGLNKAYLDQLIQAGPVTGGQVAAELAAGNEGDIRGINRAESQIAQASIGLGQTAANLMFDSGKMAGHGFLAGLQAQQKELEAAMRKLADALVEEFRRKMRIHSPSEVTRELGRMIPAGLALGIEDGRTSVTQAAARMAHASAPGAAAGGAAAGGGHFTFEWVGGGADQALITLLKNHIRIKGGNPAVLGA